MCGRNDNHGGNFLERLNLSIKSIVEALKGINYQIVLLDYNPIKNKKPLSKIFSGNKNIKHVVFSRHQHKKYIKEHLNAGENMYIKSKKIEKTKFFSERIFDFIVAFALNMAVKNSDGEYILSTTSDNIFPRQFGEYISQLEPNILYRSGVYRCRYFDSPESKKYPFDNFKNLVKGIYNENNVTLRKKFSIASASGEFLLMDRKSWKESMGYIPTIDPRLIDGDPYVIFCAMAKGKKVKATNFDIFNMRFTSLKETDKMEVHGNYCVEKGGIKFCELKELGYTIHHKRTNKETNKIEYNQWRKKGNKEWERFRKWALKTRLHPNTEYFLNINYSDRLEDIKKLFNSFLSKDFLL